MGWYVQLHWKPGLPIETKTKHRHWGIDAQCKSFGSYVWLLIAAVKSLLLSETASICGDLNVASPPNDSSNGWRAKLGKVKSDKWNILLLLWLRCNVAGWQCFMILLYCVSKQDVHRIWNNGKNGKHRPYGEWFHFWRNILIIDPVVTISYFNVIRHPVKRRETDRKRPLEIVLLTFLGCLFLSILVTGPPAYSESAGTAKKYHCNRVSLYPMIFSIIRFFLGAKNCHCSQS